MLRKQSKQIPFWFYFFLDFLIIFGFAVHLLIFTVQNRLIVDLFMRFSCVYSGIFTIIIAIKVFNSNQKKEIKLAFIKQMANFWVQKQKQKHKWHKNESDVL